MSMLALRRPSDADIAAFLDRQSRVSLSYAGVGATRSDPPSGYNVDHNRVRLGEGEAAFNRAVASVRRWEMFNIGWVMLCWPGAPIEIGQDVGILIALYGLWSLNACRIVYTLDAAADADDEVRRFGSEHPMAKSQSTLQREFPSTLHVSPRSSNVRHQAPCSIHSSTS